MFQITDLNEQEVNLILTALNEIPRKFSDALCKKLETQLVPQVKALQAELAAKADQEPVEVASEVVEG